MIGTDRWVAERLAACIADAAPLLDTLAWLMAHKALCEGEQATINAVQWAADLEDIYNRLMAFMDDQPPPESA